MITSKSYSGFYYKIH